MEQFERQGIEHVDLRMKLLDEHSRMKVSHNKNRSSVRQVAMNAAVAKVKIDKKIEKDQKKTQIKANAVESEVIEEVCAE
jgi:hypothetical protein